MSLKVLMIAFWQAAAVFGLCLLSKNRLYALLIGSAGAVVVAFIGADRYAGLDSLFVVVATLAAVWKLTPYGGGESKREALVFAAKALGVGVLSVGAFFYFFLRVGAGDISPLADERQAPPVERAPPLTSRSPELEEPRPASLRSHGVYEDVKDGMTKVQVEELLGRPLEEVEIASSDGRKVTTMWSYSGIGPIFFRNGRVRK